MDTIAHLVIQVDGKGATQAADSMNAGSKSAERMEKAIERLENTFKRNSQVFVMQGQQQAEKLENSYKRQAQSFEAAEARRAAAAQAAAVKIDLAMQRETQKFIAEQDKREKAAKQAEDRAAAKAALAVTGATTPKVGLASSVSAGYATAIGAFYTGREYIDTAVQMENLEARLRTLTGTAENSRLVFAKLQQLDRELPTNIQQITQAFLMLSNMGLEPSERALRSYSDIASAAGTDIADMAFKIQRATEGEFKPLRELGVSAHKMGDQLRLTFRGVTETVGNNVQEIEDYFIRLGEKNFSGLAAAQMDTLGGAITNLQSAWQAFVFETSKGGVGEEFKQVVKGITELTDQLAGGYRVIRSQVAGAAETFAHDISVIMAQDALRAAMMNHDASAIERETKSLERAIEAQKKFNAEKEKYLGLSKRQFDKVVPEVESNLGKFNQSTDQSRIEAQAEKERELVRKMRNGYLKELDKTNAESERANKKAAADSIKREEREAEEKKRAVENYAKWEEDYLLAAEDRFTLEHIRNYNRIIDNTEAGSERQITALTALNEREIQQATKIVEDKKAILENAYERDLKLLKTQLRAKQISQEQFDEESLKKLQKYKDDAANISFGGISASPVEDISGGGRSNLGLQAFQTTLRNQEAELATEQQFHEDKNTELANYYQDKQDLTEEYNAALEAEHERHEAKLKTIAGTGTRALAMEHLQMQSQVLGMAANLAGQLDQLAQGQGDAAKATFVAVKAIAIAQGIVNTMLGATQALALGPVGIPMATWITGLGYASVAIMAATSVQEYGQKFAGGGIVPGNSFAGDDVHAQLNSGEMVLNHSQQQNLWRKANGDGGSGGDKITVVINNLAPGTEVVRGKTTQGPDGKMVEMIVRQIKAEMINDADQGGPHSRMLQARTNMVRTGRSA